MALVVENSTHTHESRPPLLLPRPLFSLFKQHKAETFVKKELTINGQETDVVAWFSVHIYPLTFLLGQYRSLSLHSLFLSLLLFV
jgi:hypothetical protein